MMQRDHGVGSADHVISGTDPMITDAALTDVDPAGARHSPSKLGSALAVAALQCCSSKTDSMIVKK